MTVSQDAIFTAENEDAWHKIGDILAPKQVWQPILKEPRMRNISIQSLRDEAKYKGQITTKIEPYSELKFGVLIKINDHYEIDIKKDEIVNSDDILKIFEDEWRNSLKKSTSIIKFVMENL